MYKVIHRISAVRSKCSAVFTLSAILANMIKNIKNMKLKSPNVIKYSSPAIE